MDDVSRQIRDLQTALAEANQRIASLEERLQGITATPASQAGTLLPLPTTEPVFASEEERQLRLLEENEIRYRQMFELHPLPKMILDPAAGAILDANPAAAAFYGCTIADLTTHVLTDFTLAEPAELHRHMQAAIDGNTASWHLQQRLFDGTVRDVEIFAGPLYVEARELLHTVIIDITPLRATQKELAALYDATAYLFHADSLQTLGEQLVEAVVQKFQHVDCGLMVVDPWSNMITRVARSGELNIRPSSQLTITGVGLVPLAIRTGRTIYVPDVAQEVNYLPSEARTRSELVIPLKTSRGVIAALDLQRDEINGFSERDQRLLVAYAERAAAALENMQLYEEINQHATTLEARVAERTAELDRIKTRVEAIFNHSGDGILLLDVEHGIQQANLAFDRLFGFAEDSYFGFPLTALIHPDDAGTVSNILKDIEQTRLTRHTEVRAKRKDDTYFDVEISISPIQSEEQGSMHVVCIIRDISERRYAEQALRRNQADLQSVIESTDTGFVLLDNLGRVRIVNRYAKRHYEELFGIPLTIGSRLHSYLTPEEFAMFQERFLSVLAGNTISFDLTARYPGQAHHFTFHYYPVRDQNGEIVGINIAFADVTEEKEVERKLRYLASLQEHMHDAVIGTDLNYRVQSWNPAAERMYGWNAEEAIGWNLNSLTRSELQTHETEEHAQHTLLHQGYWSGEVIQHHRSGAAITILGSVVLQKDEHGAPLGIVAVNHDITDRKQAEILLRESESRYRLLAENVTDLISKHTPDGVYTFVTSSVQALLGYTPEEILGHSAYEFFHPEDLGAIQQSHEAIQQTPLVSVVAYRIRCKDGRYIWFETTSRTILDPATQAPIEIVAVSRDISGRKAAEMALQALSQRLDLAVRAGEIGIWDWDIHRDTMVWDERMYALYGISADDSSRAPAAWDIGIHPEDYTQAQTDLAAALAGERPFDTRFRVLWPDGTLRHIKANALVLRSPDGQPIRMIGVNIDITDLQQAVEREKELGELKSRFVSMASHEFRTPLSTILALTETLSAYRHKLTDEQIAQKLGKIQEQVAHLRSIIEDVLQLARMQARRITVNPVLLDLDSLCRSVIDEFESRPGFSHQIVYACDTQLREVRLDKMLMRQVISNLVSNAIKYSLPGKTVWVTLQVVSHEVILTIEDEGIGIPEADLRHLFQPFHRAANVGTISGTGLGLVITKESVELHGGTIQVSSQVDHGTQFRIAIPIERDVSLDEPLGSLSI